MLRALVKLRHKATTILIDLSDGGQDSQGFKPYSPLDAISSQHGHVHGVSKALCQLLYRLPRLYFCCVVKAPGAGLSPVDD